MKGSTLASSPVYFVTVTVLKVVPEFDQFCSHLEELTNETIRIDRETSKAEVISYTDAMAKTCQLEQRTDAAVMWKVLGLLCKHSGVSVTVRYSQVQKVYRLYQNRIG